MRQRRTRQAWQALLDEQPRSGLSIQRFCESKGMTPSSFYSWRAKLRRGQSSALDPFGVIESMADSLWIALTPPAAQPEEKWPPIIGQCAKRLLGLCRHGMSGSVAHLIGGLFIQSLISALLVVKSKIARQ